MKVIPKWRDLIIDPLDIEFKNIKIKEIISYPHAGNDVLECIGIYKNKETNFIVKLERSKMANFTNEARILKELKNKLPVPSIYEFGEYNGYKYIVLNKEEGKKLSELHNEGANVNRYLYNLGLELAKIHNLNNITTDIAMQRPINDIPKESDKIKFDKYEKEVIDYLEKSKPNIKHDTFIHGDFHYANVLWENEKLSAILDFEYSGMGFKEQDIAWSLILRPGQKFLNTIEEIEDFLKGYKKLGNYDDKKLNWCLINGYLHFYLMNKQGTNKDYLEKLKDLINHYIKKEGN